MWKDGGKYVSPIAVLTCIILQAWIDASSTMCGAECKDRSNEGDSLEHCPTVKGKHLAQWSHVFEAALNSTSLFTSESQWAVAALLFVTGISLPFISKTSKVCMLSLWPSCTLKVCSFSRKHNKTAVAKQALCFLWEFSTFMKLFWKRDKVEVEMLSFYRLKCTFLQEHIILGFFSPIFFLTFLPVFFTF